MKKITHLQKYVIDSLIKNNELSLSNFIEATSIICSKEQFDNIITYILEQNKPAVKKETRMQISMCFPRATNSIYRLDIIKIVKTLFGLGLKETKDYVDSCIGKYEIFPIDITLESINILKSKLEPYDVDIKIIGNY